ncbi:DNA invertase Pin-like site-specific DNA recombinase [Mucilaginibacter gracilis]|uniref:DNA invertase Pin-like site-specific DNA recombinase n=1 Tax=Mucilaginibacter gracilis TaxID=423350 RepID=A0A495J0X0_9SPHI|nr:recombinase family protein [Mucilaginibacter gracilis]RKR82362.1 DNA invertase Pin-like site-specific DNA recombinase [Mucilaginibacter gracilis]
MKTADLYVRVSTDEQAQKGYSPRSQEHVLRQYCEMQNIKVRNVIFEDHSAKTFNRPEWKKLLITLKKHKHKTDLLLFTKWDRFSRNTSDAYQMITTLKKLGVDPQAIEQPLDMSIPENKMMLAIYLTTPEIENDRRGLNTFFGIRQAKKEGRWMGKAPLGYANKARENGSRYIAIKEPEASVMKWVFEQLSEGIFSGEQILHAMREKGIKCSKNNFYTCVRNPAYCGKIRLAEYKDEPARLVQALHEPLISEGLFYKVQDVLDGRKKVYGLAIATPKDLPLRNFLKCPKCPRMLTGSASKGRTTYRVYYHCRSACGVRFRAEEVNKSFMEELLLFLPRKGYSELFVETVTDCYNNQTRSIKEERKELIQHINEQNNRIDKARELMLSDEIDAAEFRKVKDDASEQVVRLEAKLNTVMEQSSNLLNIRPIAEKAILNLEMLDRFFDDSTIAGQRYLVGMLFPEKLTYSEGGCRTTKMNEAASVIYVKNKELQAKKMGQKSVLKTLPHKG